MAAGGGSSHAPGTCGSERAAQRWRPRNARPPAGRGLAVPASPTRAGPRGPGRAGRERGRTRCSLCEPRSCGARGPRRSRRSRAAGLRPRGRPHGDEASGEDGTGHRPGPGVRRSLDSPGRSGRYGRCLLALSGPGWAGGIGQEEESICLGAGTLQTSGPDRTSPGWGTAGDTWRASQKPVPGWGHPSGSERGPTRDPSTHDRILSS